MRRLLPASLLALALATVAAAENDGPGIQRLDLFCSGPKGERHEIGTVICITASCQTWMARCELSQNNVTWRRIQEGCPGVSLADRLQALRRG